MEYGICLLSMIPVRKEPSDRSEMTNQILFGETFQIIEITEKWAKIITSIDNYEGWIDSKQFKKIPSIENSSKNIFNEISGFLESNDTKINIVLGSSLPEEKDDTVSFFNLHYRINGLIRKAYQPFQNKELIETALKYLGSPYLWGGRSPFGIDCSGLSQMVYKINGIQIPRDANKQAEIGETIDFINEANEGDLVFFDNEEGSIIHVGIYLGNSKIIHASGKVRIDTIDHQGIFNTETQKYSHKLRIIKRINN